MTAIEFARKMGVGYATVINWLRQGLVPGAIEKTGPKGKYWHVPASALQMERPKRGSPKGVRHKT